MTVIIKSINKRELQPKECFYHYREFEDVESIDDDCYPLIKIRHSNHQSYALMVVPDNCYLIVIND